MAENERKKIAILVGQADENYQHLFIEGFTETAFKQDMDICIFSMFRKYQNSSERELGEGNIYNLVNYDSFDGIIFLKDTIQTPGLATSIEETMHKKFKGPVLCVDIESKYYPTIWTDGYTPVKALVSHLIEHHGFTDIAFLTGKKWHSHSKQRFRAYKDCMEEHGIKVREDRIFYGDFWYTSGNMCAEQLLKHRDSLPQAVVCANDCMAIGLCEGLEENGLKIPDDIAVIGYDSIPEGRTSPVPITSAFIPAKECGIQSAIAISQLMEGKEMKVPLIEPELFIGRSCGCEMKKPDPDFGLRKGWATDLSSDSFLSLHNCIAEDMLSQTSLEGLLNILYSYVYHVRPFESLSIILNDQWKNPGMLTEGMLFSKGYTKNMLYALRTGSEENPENNVSMTETFPTTLMLPEIFEDRPEPRAFIFTPLFFEASCFGYTVINYGNRPQSYTDTFRLWVTSVSRGLECVRRMENLHALREGTFGVNNQKFSEIFYDHSKKAMEIQRLSPEEREELEIVEKLLDNNLFTYYFQPIVSAQTGEIYAYEALMRANTEKKINPLQILKYSGLVDRLADVEKATFLNVLTRIENNLSEFADRRVFINSIPGIHLNPDEDFKIETRLLNHPGKVVVELTEQAELGDEELAHMKNRFNGMNIQTAVDDYGTGYSNINNLLRYMPDYVKIDRALLSGIQDNSQKQHFVREIIEFSHDNNILALAEGVETSEELRTLILLGVDLIQGYYTARPNPEILQEIDPVKKNEIVRYATERAEGIGGKIYIAGKTNRISLNNLAKDGYSIIQIGGEATYRDVSIIGSPGLRTKIRLNINEDYSGQITLENASLQSSKTKPCIVLNPGSDVSLHLKGDNHIIDGGILVPEGSKLTLEGDGNLNIDLNGREYYGIGAGPDEKHGTILFLQDGCISLNANGDSGIGIGSGLGGPIIIQRGKYVLRQNGNYGIAVGCFKGDFSLDFYACDFEADMSVFNGICVGTIDGKVNINIIHSSVKCYMGGNELIGIGGFSSPEVNLLHSHSVLQFDMRGTKLTSIGCVSGKTNIKTEQAALRIKIEGQSAIAYGNFNDQTEVLFDNADTVIRMKSEYKTETLAKDENIQIINGRYLVTVNEDSIERVITDGQF